MIIEPATIEDLAVILALRTEASRWLAEQSIDQWSDPWPSAEGQDRRIVVSIQAGETWMIRDENEATMATVALDTYSDPDLWTPDERAEPAMYMHRFIVRCKHAGLGRALVGWACSRAHRLGYDWLRIDVWTDNTKLHRYYEYNGFQHVRTLDLPDYPSGALFQRSTADCSTP